MMMKSQCETYEFLSGGEFGPAISAEHADELRCYFRNSGLGVFDRSTLGAQLQRVELYSKPARPCVRCGGDSKSWRPGIGFVPPEWGAESSRCFGGSADRSKLNRQTLSRERRLLVALLDFAEAHPEERFASTVECPTCRGFGWIAGQWPVSGQVTARPTGSSVGGAGGVNVSDVAMHALAVVSARLAIATRLCSECEGILEGYYGPDSGGILNLWPMTAAGKTLLRRNSIQVDPLRYLANERAAQEFKPNPGKRRLFDACDQQARELLEKAGRAWNAAVKLASNGAS